MSTEVAPQNVFELVNQQESFFKNVSESDIVKWEKESQFSIQQLQKNDFLQKAAMNNQASLQNAIINVAAVGISLNPASKHAYLVPRDGMVCLDVSYIGLMHLAVQSGAIVWGQAKLVHENDEYTNNGIDKAPTHKSKTFGDKGAIIGAYCTVKLPSGDYLTEEMDIKALEKVKSSSKAANGPWKTWPEEMMRKTVVKRASKYWPNCERLNAAIDVVNQHEGLVEQETYSEKEKQHFDELVQKQSAFSMCAFMSTRSEEVETGLINSFKKGEISKNKELVRKLCSVGFNEWQSFVSDIRTYLAEDDEASIQSELEGFLNYEKQMLINLLGDDSQKLIDLIGGE